MRIGILAVAIVVTAAVGCGGVENQASLTEELSVFRWSNDYHLGTSTLTPVVAALQNAATVVYRGACDSCGPYLRSESYYGADYRFIHATSTSQPALAAFNGFYYMFYASHLDQYMARYDTTQGIWSESTLLPFSSLDAPAIAAFEGKLYIIRQNPPDGQLFWQTMDVNETFSTENPLRQNTFGGCRSNVINGSRVASSLASQRPDFFFPSPPEYATATPGLTVYGDCLYLAHRDIATGSLVYNTFHDGWGTARVIPNGPGGSPQTSALQPSIAAYGGALHLVHVSDSGTYGDSIYWSTLDPNNGWSAALTIPNRQTHGTPSLAAMNDRLLMAHLGGNDGDTALWGAEFH
jgi:hypothetical protein